jgi:hypothetical protein
VSGRSVDEIDPAVLAKSIDELDRPAVVRGLVGGWPAVAAGRQSAAAVAAYLQAFDRNVPVRTFIGPPEIEGRYFYAPELRGFNFGISNTSLPQLLATLLHIDGRAGAQSLYMGSTATAELLPGFAEANPLSLAEGRQARPRIWIGNNSRVAPHFDESNNIACVVSGRRRFVLFPPEQVANLYVGPLDQTMAGQPSSMVDLRAPDLDRFPRFAEAMRHALTADLEPGDAIFIPSLWWHGVEAFGPLNVLINYWWQAGAGDGGSPTHALGHGLLTISHLPERERRAWRALFDHFVFQLDGDPAAHIPPAARGILGESTPALRQRMKQFLLQALGHLSR